MGLRLEVIITFLIVFITAGAFLIKIKTDNIEIVKVNKDLAFEETVFIEVNTQKRLSQMYAEYGVRNKDVLDLEFLEYHTQSVNALKASKGRYSKDILYLSGDVYIEDADGYNYTARKAHYNQKEEKLYVPTHFTAEQGKNEFRGEYLQYNSTEKALFAREVNATLYTVKK